MALKLDGDGIISATGNLSANSLVTTNSPINISSGASDGAITIDSDGVVTIDGRNTGNGDILKISPRDNSGGVGYITYESTSGNSIADIGVPSDSNELVVDIHNVSTGTLIGRKMRIQGDRVDFADDVYSDLNRLATEKKALAFSLVFGG
jgi:hypothetical protein